MASDSRAISTANVPGSTPLDSSASARPVTGRTKGRRQKKPRPMRRRVPGSSAPPGQPSKRASSWRTIDAALDACRCKADLRTGQSTRSTSDAPPRSARQIGLCQMLHEMRQCRSRAPSLHSKKCTPRRTVQASSAARSRSSTRLRSATQIFASAQFGVQRVIPTLELHQRLLQSTPVVLRRPRRQDGAQVLGQLFLQRARASPQYCRPRGKSIDPVENNVHGLVVLAGEQDPLPTPRGVDEDRRHHLGLAGPRRAGDDGQWLGQSIAHGVALLGVERRGSSRRVSSATRGPDLP